MSVLRISHFAKCLFKNDFKILFFISDRSHSKCHKISNLPLINQYKFLHSKNKFKYLHFKNPKRYFHTTQCHRIQQDIKVILPPLIVPTLIFMLACLFEIIIKNQSPYKKVKFYCWLKRRKYYIITCFCLYFSSILMYYLAHLEYDPLSKRTKFILFNEKQKKKFSKFLYESMIGSNSLKITPETDAIHENISKITAKIINANKDLESFKNKNWTLTVIDSFLAKMIAAFVLPGGNIFVSLGFLYHMENHDQLSVVLSHEMAHCVLDHTFEALSHASLIILLLLPLIVLKWVIFPGFFSGLLSFFGLSIGSVIHYLKYRRDQETEADHVGLIIAAKACVDVREAVVIFGTFRTLEEEHMKILKTLEKNSWLRDHPSHSDREKKLNELLPEVLECRSQAGCPALSKVDPRESFYKLSSTEEVAERLFKNSEIFVSQLENQKQINISLKKMWKSICGLFSKEV